MNINAIIIVIIYHDAIIYSPDQNARVSYVIQPDSAREITQQRNIDSISIPRWWHNYNDQPLTSKFVNRNDYGNKQIWVLVFLSNRQCRIIRSFRFQSGPPLLYSFSHHPPLKFLGCKKIGSNARGQHGIRAIINK